MTTTPTSTPRWEVSAGSRSRASGLRQAMGQKAGRLNRLQVELGEVEVEVEESLDNINLLSLLNVIYNANGGQLSRKFYIVIAAT